MNLVVHTNLNMIFTEGGVHFKIMLVSWIILKGIIFKKAYHCLKNLDYNSCPGWSAPKN